ncbi:hypothetical protein M7I_4582 [Glarea lozoyensis 74030]|uniref:Uncharacterized protein n=1 Tax=Glarea lozoyensis (strain ATCC 74030 / MF5533) TaxID=1104152 RepID=H0EPK1_GLAL7|nr:hypothetical protein M7I_4582 [Glarea lozoyensis 74030]
MASGVGPFALDEGLVKVLPGQTEVKNVQVDDEGHFWEFGDCHIGGVKAAGSEIKVQFVKPAGSMTATTPPYEQELHESFFSPEESLFEDKKVKIQHASGNIDAVVRKDILGANVESVSLSRTARRIFSGNVLFDI